jgi:hypothetical protein
MSRAAAGASCGSVASGFRTACSRATQHGVPRSGDRLANAGTSAVLARIADLLWWHGLATTTASASRAA